MKWQVPFLVLVVCLGGAAQAQVWRVDPTAPGVPDGLTWATAYPTIQQAIDTAYAAGGGQVWVAGGTIGSPRIYDEVRTEAWGAPASVTGSLVMKDNVQVYGGFSGYNSGAGRQETQLSERNRYLFPTVIDGSTARAGSAAYHVVVFGRATAETVNARLDGFYIQGGNASGVMGDYHTWRGGGIFVWQSAPVIANCVIRNNVAEVSGGGIALEAGSASKANAVIENCLIVQNTANRGLDSSSNPIRGGAGIFNNQSAPVITFMTNANNTLTDNTSGLFGLNSGGIYNWDGSPVINSCIFAALPGAVITEGPSGFTSAPVISYTRAGVLFPGPGNITANALLDADWMPQPGSPCIDTADPAAHGTDLRGVIRPVNGVSDMGAYEYTPNGPVAVCNSASLDLAVNNQITDPAVISSSTAEAGIWYQELENKTFTCTDIPSSTLDLTVYDVLGRTATCTATISVTESVPPVVTLNGPATMTLECPMAYTEQGATATDACDGTLSVTTSGTVNAGVPGTYVLTYSATDSIGNTGTATRTVNVVDTTDPVITVNGANPITLECGSTFTDPGATATDACDGTLSVTTSGTVNAGVPGTYTLTYTATDSSSNSATATRTVNVVDTTDPVITVNGANPITLECGSTFTDPGATATDACDGTLSVTTSGTVNAGVPGTYTLTYTATDSSSNSVTAARTVNVVDTTDPVITVSGANPETVDCGSAYTDPGATATDACDGTLSVTTSGSVDTGVPGTYTLTYTATDSSSNSAMATRTVNVVDVSAPVLTLNGANPETVECGSVYTDPGASAVDACEGPVNVSVSGTVNTAVPGIYTLTYVAADSLSNTATVARTVNVADTTAPVITIPGPNPVYVPLNSTFTAPVASATDVCDGNLGSVTGTGTVDTSVSGTYTVTYTASDAASNTAVATLTVEVLANLPPVITILGENPATLECGDEYTDAGATANDYEDGDLTASITVSGLPPAGPLSPGTWTVTYSVTDSNNQTTTAIRTVNVLDTSVPAVTIAGGNALSAECGVALTLPDATAADPCAGALSVSVTDLDGLDVNNPAVGVYNVVYSANDGYNTGTATLVVTVTDNQAPVLTVPGPNPVYLHTGDAYTPPPGVVADVCEGPSTVFPSGTLDVNTPGTYVLTYTAADSSGNQTEYELTVLVADDFAPVITLAGGPAVTLNCGDQYTTAGVATAADIEDGDLTAAVTASGEPPAGPVGPGTWTVIFSVTDSFGNVATAQQVVTVQNNCTLTVTAANTTIDAVVGDNVSLEVTVTGAVGTVTYQWYREDGSKAWQAVPGANSGTLSFNPVALSDAGQYQCEVSDAVTSVYSPTITLNVSNGVPAAGPIGLVLLSMTLAGLGALRRRNRR